MIMDQCKLAHMCACTIEHGCGTQQVHAAFLQDPLVWFFVAVLCAAPTRDAISLLRSLCSMGQLNVVSYKERPRQQLPEAAERMHDGVQVSEGTVNTSA